MLHLSTILSKRGSFEPPHRPHEHGYDVLRCSIFVWGNMLQTTMHTGQNVRFYGKIVVKTVLRFHSPFVAQMDGYLNNCFLEHS